MTVSLIGGPLDGALTEGLSHLPVYMIATNHGDKPVYKKACCGHCEHARDAVPYVFIGYEDCNHESAV